MPAHPASALVADIGGTHARFALQDAEGVLSAERVLAVAAYQNSLAAIDHYLSELQRPRLHGAALAIAAPIDLDASRASLTNAGWTFERAEIARTLGLATHRVLLINDFTALAQALPLLAHDELRQIGGAAARAEAPKALLGAGTGLGVSGLLPSAQAGQWVALAGEGGHVTLAAADAYEAAILARARNDFEHVSAERLLCGAGLARLHVWSAEVDGRAASRLDAPAIVAAALSGDMAARRTVDVFCGFLGALAGNLALTLGARGGVYLGGGIVPRLGALLDDSPFRARFEQKGRFAAYLAAIPAYVILAPAPALRGAALALSNPGPAAAS